jgi:hypothetical protein
MTEKVFVYKKRSPEQFEKWIQHTQDTELVELLESIPWQSCVTLPLYWNCEAGIIEEKLSKFAKNLRYSVPGHSFACFAVRKWDRFSGLVRSCDVLIACELPLQRDTIEQAWYSIFSSPRAKAHFERNIVSLKSHISNPRALSDCLKAIEDPGSERFLYGLKEFDTDNAANRSRVQNARRAAEEVRVMAEHDRQAAEEEARNAPPSWAQIEAARAETRAAHEKCLRTIPFQWFGHVTTFWAVEGEPLWKRLERCVKLLMSDHNIRIGYFAVSEVQSPNTLSRSHHLYAWFVSEIPLPEAIILAAWHSVTADEEEQNGSRREAGTMVLEPYAPSRQAIAYPRDSDRVYCFGLEDFTPNDSTDLCDVENAKRAAEQVQKSEENLAEQARRREAARKDRLARHNITPTTTMLCNKDCGPQCVIDITPDKAFQLQCGHSLFVPPEKIYPQRRRRLY